MGIVYERQIFFIFGKKKKREKRYQKGLHFDSLEAHFKK